MKLKFLGCATAALQSKYGTNSAYLKAFNNGANMLLMDCGGMTKYALKKTEILEDSALKRVIAFFSHNHDDHINRAKFLFEHCKDRNIDLSVLLPSSESSRSCIVSALADMGINTKKMPTISSREAADMLNLNKIGFETMRHDKFSDTTALILEKKNIGNRRRTMTVFAADNNDPHFIKNVINDSTLEDLYTDGTNKPEKSGTPHLPFEILKKIVPYDLRDRVTVMHMPKGLPEQVEREGFNSAVDLLHDPKIYKNNRCRSQSFCRQL